MKHLGKSIYILFCCYFMTCFQDSDFNQAVPQVTGPQEIKKSVPFKVVVRVVTCANCVYLHKGHRENFEKYKLLVIF